MHRGLRLHKVKTTYDNRISFYAFRVLHALTKELGVFMK